MDEKQFLRKKPSVGGKQEAYTLFFRIIPWIIITFGLWLATQKFAQLVDYQPDIVGYPFKFINDTPIYYPWLYLNWLISYLLNSEYQEALYTALNYWLVFIGLAIITMVVLAALRRFISKNNAIFNSSKLSTTADLRKAGMLEGRDIPLCQLYDAKIKIKQYKGQLSLSTKKPSGVVNALGLSHVLVSAPPRSYKGVSVLIPFLFRYKKSVFVTDYKGELYSQTAGFRKKFSRVILWAPGSWDSAGFNFLMQIRPGADAWDDALMLATTHLAPKTEKEAGNEEHFRVNATTTLTGIILHVLCSNYQDKSMPGVMDWLTQADAGNDENTGDKSVALWEEMINTEHSDPAIHKKIVAVANAQLTRPSRERGSVTSTILKALLIYMDDRVRQNTTRNDFSYEDFIDCDTPISLYMSISNAKIDQHDVLIKLFVTMFLRRMTDGETSYDNIRLKNELVFCLDECNSLGAFNFLQKAMAIVPGYGIRFLLVWQSFSQIEAVYGPNHQFMSLCKHIIIYAPGDFKTAEYFSKVIGKNDVWKESIGSSGNRYDIAPSNLSSNGSLAEANIINPSELMQMPFNQCLVFTQGQDPYLGKKIVSYDDERYKNNIYSPKSNKKDLVPPKTFEEIQTEIAPLRKLSNDMPWYALPLFTCLEKTEEIIISEELIDPRLKMKKLAIEALNSEDTEKYDSSYKCLLAGI